MSHLAATIISSARILPEGGVISPKEFLNLGTRAPATGKVLAAIEAQSCEVIVPSGAAAANVLGLTTQVPVREVFITSGARTIQLNGA